MKESYGEGLANTGGLTPASSCFLNTGGLTPASNYFYKGCAWNRGLKWS